MPISGNSPLTIDFTDTSTGEPTSWAWQFPGGTPTTSNEQNPTVIFTDEGEYNVILIASNSNGSGPPVADVVIVLSGTASTVTLTINISGGGSVTGAGSHTEGSTVVINASADAGYEFDSWFGSDGGSIADIDSNNTTIFMDGNKSINVFFAPENGGGS